ncbi:MAG TPA: hypothetical protein VM734_13055 [Kofleriaceae bacterium]|jgi:hypothetical protein|nr:hypothetical protein [Kofleriaceae bacterium]
MRLAGLLLLVAAVGCGDELDDRPATTEYITAAILRPSCGTAACHSSQNRRENIVLDTIEGVEANAGGIYGAVSSTNDAIVPRMPLDGPLPQKDIDLILAWQEEGFPRN